MDIASLPLVCTPLDDLVRRANRLFFIHGENRHAFLFGDATVAAGTLKLFERVERIYAQGSDEFGLKPQTLSPFMIEPGRDMGLWLYDLHARDCLVRITPHWMKRMRPVLEIALKEADDEPDAERLYRSDGSPLGWRRIRTAVECGSD